MLIIDFRVWLILILFLVFGITYIVIRSAEWIKQKISQVMKK